MFKADKISYDFDFMGTDEMTLDGNNNVALKVQIGIPSQQRQGDIAMRLLV